MKRSSFEWLAAIACVSISILCSAGISYNLGYTRGKADNKAKINSMRVETNPQKLTVDFTIGEEQYLMEVGMDYVTNHQLVTTNK